MAAKPTEPWRHSPGHVLLLRPAPGATQRTRNRIREHRGAFRLIRGPEPLACLGGRPSVLLQPMGIHTPNEGWWGWLPVEEIVVEELPPPSDGGVSW